MATPPGRSPRQLLVRARNDRDGAQAELDHLALDAQVALVCETPLAMRGALLGLASDPAPIIEALPEAELCFTAKAIGLHDASWMLASATPEQLVACVDLDAWGRGAGPDPARLDAWLAALAHAGEEPLMRAAHALDMELLLLWLSSRIDAELKPNDDEGWEPPDSSKTLDGQFYFMARRAKDDLAEVEQLLDTLFRNDYWRYYRLLQAVRWELSAENEEWALRWRTGRLQDLGFPEWEEAMRIYGVVSAPLLSSVPEARSPQPIGEWTLPVWMPKLPVAADSRWSVFRAIAGLPESERRPFLFAFLALANKIAVADRLSLGDADTVPLALERAAGHTSRGLDHLAAENDLDPVEVLRRVPLERLFRVGFTLSGEQRPAPPEDAADPYESPRAEPSESESLEPE